MYGLFGGFLTLIDLVGGVVLYVLIGSKAWIETKRARSFRLAMGSLSSGLVIGTILYSWSLLDILTSTMVSAGIIAGSSKTLTAIFIYFLGIPLTAYLVTLILEGIRASITEGNGRNQRR